MNSIDSNVLENLVQTSPLGIVIVDAVTLTIELVNDAYLQVIGKTYDETVGNHVWKVFAEAGRERMIKAIGEALQYRSSGVYDIEYAIVNPNNPVPRIVKARGKRGSM